MTELAKPAKSFFYKCDLDLTLIILEVVFQITDQWFIRTINIIYQCHWIKNKLIWLDYFNGFYFNATHYIIISTKTSPIHLVRFTWERIIVQTLDCSISTPAWRHSWFLNSHIISYHRVCTSKFVRLVYTIASIDNTSMVYTVSDSARQI
jgi:hypothetical protein